MTLVAYVGNFDPPHSTENHVRQALQNLGHDVMMLPEQRLDWSTLPAKVKGCDLVLWTRTAGFDPGDRSEQGRIVKGLDIPTVGFHLDRWWGLAREKSEGGPASSDPSPFFFVDFLFTADGGHDDKWKEIGANHHWSPPAVLSNECEVGQYRDDLAAEVGFVGNLRNYGHLEWQGYRRRLYKFLALTYRGRFKLWEGGMRGRDLADLYQSVKVLVGDSCLAGGITKYHSDRIPETLGRGGYLIHPYLDHLASDYPMLPMYPLGDFDALRSMIDTALAHDDERRMTAARARTHVLAHHTYEHRLARVLDVVLG